jgi:hypothetical protein
MSIATFASQEKFRAWLEQLCFGWIDGVRRAVDEESFSIWFAKGEPIKLLDRRAGT